MNNVEKVKRAWFIYLNELYILHFYDMRDEDRQKGNPLGNSYSDVEIVPFGKQRGFNQTPCFTSFTSKHPLQIVSRLYSGGGEKKTRM